MRRVGIFGQHHVAPRRLSRATIGLAARDRIIIVRRAVEDADRAAGDVGVGRYKSSSNPDRTGCRPANCAPDLFQSLWKRFRLA